MTYVLGLTGKEPVVITEQTSFCSLCSRLIPKGDEAVAAGAAKKFLIHPDCALASFTKESRKFYLENVTSGRTPRRTRTQQKKIHVSDGKTKCSFCRKTVQPGDTYSLVDDKAYHTSGRNSCLVRFRRVLNNVRTSIY